MPPPRTARRKSCRAPSMAACIAIPTPMPGSRAKRLAKALLALGVQSGDRVGSLAWNTHHHFELFYGVSGIGAVLHTINPRLFDEQIAFIVNHAEDRWICFDDATLPVAQRIAPSSDDGRRARSIWATAPRFPPDRPACARLRGVFSLRRMPNTIGHSSTSSRPRPSATPRARPACRKASSTRIGRPCSAP